MADAAAIAVAKAAATVLEAATLSKTFTTEWSFADWSLDLTKMEKVEGFDLKECEKLRVDLVPNTTQQGIQQIDRGEWEFRILLDIVVRYKFGPDTREADSGRIAKEEVAELVYFGQQVLLLLAGDALGAADYGDATRDELQILGNPIKEHLKDIGQFTAHYRIAYVLYKNV